MPKLSLSSTRGMLACFFRWCPRGHDRTPTNTKCAEPQSNERQRAGLAPGPLSHQLVRRLLIELPQNFPAACEKASDLCLVPPFLRG